MVGPACVSDLDLRAYLVGRLPRRLAQLVDDHLEVCPRCEAQARELACDDDTLIRSLRCAAGRGPVDTTVLLVRPGDPGPAAAPAPAGPALPRQIGGYEVIEEIGRGGMSVVYLARQLRPSRLVALKMLLAGAHADPARRARLAAEADAIACLRHPHIVQVHQAGEHDGLPFLVLEYVGGGSLAQRLSGLPLPPARAAALVETLAQAVQHSHEHGVVHRDLKPANVLFTEEGQPKVTDFGLAKHERPELTATGAVLGTPSYMAPEQATGDTHGVGPAVDVYALGAILYECLTGRPPFRAPTVLETLEQVRTQEPVPPRRLQPRLPRDLDTICLKCLAREPHRRYPSAQALADDLRRFQGGRPILARPVGAAAQLGRWARRSPGWAAMLLTVAALLLLILVGGSIVLVRLKGALDSSDEHLGQARAADRATQEQLFDSLLAQARSRCYSRRPGQRFESLQIVARAADLARQLELPPQRVLELRNVAILALSLPDLHLGQTLKMPGASKVGIDFDEDFATYAWVDHRGSWEVRRVLDNRLLHRLPAPSAAGPGATARSNGLPGQESFRPHLSRDGRFLLVSSFGPGDSRGPGQVWRLREDRPPELLVAMPAAVYSADFDRDNRHLALGLVQGHVLVYELDGKQPGRRLQVFPAALPLQRVDVALHPSRPWVAISCYSTMSVQVRDYLTGAKVANLRQPTGVSDVAWHPDGHLLAVSDGDGNDIRLYEMAAFPPGPAQRISNIPPSRTLTAQGKNTRMVFNPRGDRLAARGSSGCVQLFDLATGKLLVQTANTLVTLPRLRFSRDGRRLAGEWIGEQLGIWEVGDAREHRSLTQRGGTALGSGADASSPPSPVLRYHCPSAWTDSRLLAVPVEGRDSWRWRFWDLETGAELGALPGNLLPVGVVFPQMAVQTTPQGHPLRGGLVLPPGPTTPGALVVDAAAGMLRWPVEPGPKGRGTLRIGPPQKLSPIRAFWRGHSSDGKLVVGSTRAVPELENYAGAWVLRLDRPNPPLLHLVADRDCQDVAIRPQGDLVVTSPHLYGVNRVWHVPDGRLVKELDVAEGTFPRFSPDGKWLAVSGDPGALFAVGTWERGLRFSGWAQFSPDSRLLAVNTRRGQIRLIDIASGVEVAELASTDETDGDHLFTPDGTRIIYTSNDKEGGIHVWDLRALRRQLRLLDLDWDAPDYPPEEEGPRPPLRLEIVP